ncbi:hypothetical protein T492DRAFT_903343 [Pavlovales sp. CCMP2436]|nr:hypothetical protein T492DRAFT_903343 [Pavlovales sp. CCMP2436]
MVGFGAVLPLLLLRTYASDACAGAGFTAELACSSCDALGDFLDSASPHLASCRQCCTENDRLKFASAVIDLGRFVAHLASAHTVLAVTYTQGAAPTLTLTRMDGTTDVEPISAWTATELDAYLQRVL